MRKVQRMLSKLGAGCINKLWRLGAGARLFWLTLISSGESFLRSIRFSLLDFSV